MTAQQIELLAEIQRLTLAGSKQTGRRMYHEVQPWGDGIVWSIVRVIEGSATPLHTSRVVVHDGDDAVPDYDPSLDRCTLIQQRDALVQWIADNRKEEAA
jgi:hypothetical protein